ncbi:MAG: hypothetical protein HC772_15255 [Leptolyngbyaceae cyanobacterium CRU_2_3]|nr:hypothetical protein [Leptolyngbyaceae cyanobacterium CRU_2_3]
MPSSIKQATPTTPIDSPTAKLISEAKRSLILQLLEMTGGRRLYEQMQQILTLQMQQQMRPMMEQIINSNTDYPC